MWLAALSAAYAMKTGAHFALRFLVDRTPPKVQRWIGAVVALSSAAFLAVFAYQALRFTIEVHDMLAPATRMSMAIPYSSAFVGSALTLYYGAALLDFDNDGAGLFRDESAASQLGPPSLPFTTFGIGWIDYDNDSWLDVLAVNGAVIGIDALIRAGDPYPLRQANQLLRNGGDGAFREVTAEAGVVVESSEVSRAAAFGDVDNDGDLDVVVVNSNGPARLLFNQVGQSRPWLGLRLVAHNRDALGAHVLVHRADAPPIWRHVHTDGSYASARDPRVLVGLGDGENAGVSHVEVRWADGTAERWTDVRPGEYQTLVQGEGKPWVPVLDEKTQSCHRRVLDCEP